MKTLIYGAGPIGRSLALRLHQAANDVTLLARGETHSRLARNGIEIVDGLTGDRLHAQVKVVDRLKPQDRYDLVIVAMVKASRLEVCPVLAENPHLENILFLGNDVGGAEGYLRYLSRDQVLLGFPDAGGGWEGDDLVVIDREKPDGKGQIWIGELDGNTRERTLRIKRLFDESGITANIEKEMNGWLKYHFAFVGPTTGAIFRHGGDMNAVAADSATLHQYCAACREAGDVLRKVGYRRRQPLVFNLFYWLPRWLEPRIFSRLFGARESQVRFALHAKAVGPEMVELIAEFQQLAARAQLATPNLDALLSHIPGVSDEQEVAA